MPNRKREVGWYLLPKSETPYHGPIPDGVKPLTDAQLDKAIKAHEKTSGAPVANQGDGGSGGAGS